MAEIRSGEARATRRGILIGSAKIAVGGTLAAVVAGRGTRAGFAQGTPVTGAAMGYPEVKVTITDQSYEVSTQTVPAGYVLLTVTNSSKQPTGAAVLGPGPGQTMAELQRAAATPLPENESIPRSSIRRRSRAARANWRPAARRRRSSGSPPAIGSSSARGTSRRPPSPPRRGRQRAPRSRPRC